MALPKLAWVAVNAAISFLAAKLLAPKIPSAPLDDSVSEPSVRGMILGTFHGNLRLAPAVGWVGSRVYHAEIGNQEHGVHFICFGQGRSLTRILSDGKTLWEGELTPDTHPSGSSYTISPGNTFDIYWGEDNQPVCDMLADRTGVGSAWPNVFYVYWHSKVLNGAVWPTMEYEVTVLPKELESGGVVGESFFDDTPDEYEDIPFEVRTDEATVSFALSLEHFKFRMVGEDVLPNLLEGMDLSISEIGYLGEITNIDRTGGYTYISVTAYLPQVLYTAGLGNEGWNEAPYGMDFTGFADRGVSPAMGLQQFLHAQYPWGAGLSPTLFDDSLQDVYDVLDSESVVCSSLIKSGRSWKDAVASLMQDMGLLFYFDQDTGLYGFKTVREATVDEVYDGSQFSDDSLYESFGYSTLASDSRIFSYTDAARKFKTSTILLTDDSSAKYGSDPNTKKVSLETITSLVPATTVASRRDKELDIDGSLSLDLTYDECPRVGDKVALEGYTKDYRVSSVESNPDEAKRSVSLLEDAYSVDSSYIVRSSEGLNPASRTTVGPDLAGYVLEVNRFWNPGTDGYHFLRIRSNSVGTSAVINDCSDDLSYTPNTDVSHVTGGALLESMEEIGHAIVDEGPTFTPYGPDIDLVEDLSSQDTEWRGGSQMCLIGTELFYLQALTKISDTEYRLDGLIRGRLGTASSAHAVGSNVFIFYKSDVATLTRAWITDGVDIYCKSLPYSSESAVDIADAQAISIEYGGGGYKPLAPENLNTTNDANAWVSGDDAVLRWDYKNASSVTGAGVGLSNTVSSLALPEGQFKITIKNGTTTVREAVSLVTNTFTYTQAMMSADFGSEPSTFNVEVVEVLNGLTSDPDSTTIERV